MSDKDVSTLDQASTNKSVLRLPSPADLTSVDRGLPPSINEAHLPPSVDGTMFRTADTEPSRWAAWSFLLMVVVPFALSVLYFAFFAANQYEVEFRFSVTEVNPILPTIGGPPGGSTSQASSALSSALGSLSSTGLAVSPSAVQNYIVVDYLKSRQAVLAVQKSLDLRNLYSVSAAHGDFIAGFDSSLPLEKLVEYWNSMTTAYYDPVTGLSIAKVRSFDPESALKIGNLLVKLAEEQVNSIERRAQVDSIRSADNEVKRSQTRLQTATADLAAFRLKNGVIDPTAAVSANGDLRKALRASLAQLQTDLASLYRQRVGPNAPSVLSLKSRIAATRDQLNEMEQEVSKNPEQQKALADMVGRYEKLDMERQYAMSMLVASRQALDQARANAFAQHLFLTPYVLPDLPMAASYPKKYQWLFGILLTLCLVWVLFYMAVRSLRDRMALA